MAIRNGLGPKFGSVLTGAQNGSSRDFELLFRAYSGPVTAFASARGNDDPEAISNDVLLKVFQHLDGFDGDESAFTGWVFAIARNRLIDAHRAAARRPAVADGVEVPEEGFEQSSEEAALRGLSLQSTISQLECLTDDQRDVIALRMVADLSLEQVSEIVERPVSAVKALQRRGLRRLQKEILPAGVS